MTATPPPPAPPPAPPRSGMGAGRVVALVFGILLLLPGLGLLAGGGVLLWAHWTDRSDGFLVSPEESFSSEGYALVSERIELQTTDWLPLTAALGSARVEITGAGDDDVFVGIASAADVTAYLGGVQRTVVDALGFDAPPSSGDQLPGGPPAGPPTAQDFWIAQSSGPGTQQVTWDPDAGDWMFVVMNADGSAGVDVQGRIGAEVPALGGLGWGLLITGLLLTAVAVLLLVIAIRRPADRRAPIPPAGYSRATAVPPPRVPTADDAPQPQPQPRE